jgi:hypothetical protein
MLGTIYRIQSRIDDQFYIGSTIQPLKKRLKNHKSKAKDRPQTPLYAHFNQCGWEHAYIVCVREIQVSSKRELLLLEKEEIMRHLSTPECLNVARPCITHQEKKDADREYGKKRRIEKRDVERERVCQWRLNNPEKYAEQVKRSMEKQRMQRETTYSTSGDRERNRPVANW